MKWPLFFVNIFLPQKLILNTEEDFSELAELIDYVSF